MTVANSRVVRDASFALEAVLPTSAQWQHESWDLFDRIASGDTDVAVPWIFFAEIAAACTRKVRARVMEPTDAADFIEQLDSLPLMLDLTLDRAAGLHARAMQWQCGAYDAIYLALAQRLDLPLATRDRGLRTAAQAARVSLY